MHEKQPKPSRKPTPLLHKLGGMLLAASVAPLFAGCVEVSTVIWQDNLSEVNCNVNSVATGYGADCQPVTTAEDSQRFGDGVLLLGSGAGFVSLGLAVRRYSRRGQHITYSIDNQIDQLWSEMEDIGCTAPDSKGERKLLINGNTLPPPPRFE